MTKKDIRVLMQSSVYWRQIFKHSIKFYICYDKSQFLLCYGNGWNNKDKIVQIILVFRQRKICGLILSENFY